MRVIQFFTKLNPHNTVISILAIADVRFIHSASVSFILYRFLINLETIIILGMMQEYTLINTPIHTHSHTCSHLAENPKKTHTDIWLRIKPGILEMCNDNDTQYCILSCFQSIMCVLEVESKLIYGLII